MSALPDGFTETLARVLEPGHEELAAEVIEAATMLDDEGLRVFLQLFAGRVRASGVPVRGDELRTFLQRAAGAGAP
ncbi:MAG TPA: hypothetical protein VLU92_11705 [Candidatus Dormibacteraeota bacterium]|nr:hypothetical protein [Candidatus Dormibacteraeota bacterium]